MAVLRGAQRTVVWLVEFTDQEPVEINLPDASALGPQRHWIARQRFADKAHAAPPVNLAALLHPAQQPAIAPHAWLHDGSSLYDHFGKGFTLLAHKDASQSLIDEAQQQARAAGVPLKVVQPREAGLQSLYPTRLTLIRPDQHVAWRGNVLPGQSMGLFERVTGRVQIAAQAEVMA